MVTNSGVKLWRVIGPLFGSSNGNSDSVDATALTRCSASSAMRTRSIPRWSAAAGGSGPPAPEERKGSRARAEEPPHAQRHLGAAARRGERAEPGHRRGPATDLFYDGKHFRELRAPRIRTRHTHGTGCTLSAAIAAYLAKGRDIESAVMLAKKFITEAIRQSFAIGAGHSPVHHFHRFWKS